MRMKAALAGLGMVLWAGAAFAQEPAAPAAEAEEAGREEVLKIRVLDNPYDIASFYRSRQAETYGYFGPRAGTPDYAGRYPIASYYRQRSGASFDGVSPFWARGYPNQAGIALALRRRIGENGELFLFAPTFLAPIGPLTGVFLLDQR